MKKDVVEKIKFSSKMQSVASDSEGAARGLLFLYSSKKFQVNAVFNEGNILLYKVVHLLSNKTWFLLNIYAPNNKRGRREYWTRVEEKVRNLDVKKGIILGDFNTPLVDGEKMGGLPPDLESKQDLANFINNLTLLDLDLLGGSFTWSNQRIGRECIQVRLDRALVSPD